MNILYLRLIKHEGQKRHIVTSFFLDALGQLQMKMIDHSNIISENQ